MLNPSYPVSLRDEGGRKKRRDVKSVIPGLPSGRGGLESVKPYPYISASLRDGGERGGGGGGGMLNSLNLSYPVSLREGAAGVGGGEGC